MQIGQELHKRRPDALVRLMAGTSPAPARGAVPTRGVSGTAFRHGFSAKDPAAGTWLTPYLAYTLSGLHLTLGLHLTCRHLWLWRHLWLCRQSPGSWIGPRSREDLGFWQDFGLLGMGFWGMVCGLGPRVSAVRPHLMYGAILPRQAQVRPARPSLRPWRCAACAGPPLCAVRAHGSRRGGAN